MTDEEFVELDYFNDDSASQTPELYKRMQALARIGLAVTPFIPMFIANKEHFKAEEKYYLSSKIDMTFRELHNLAVALPTPQESE